MEITNVSRLIMSSANIEEDAMNRRYTRPYGKRHQIPTIEGYREHRKEIEENYDGPDEQTDAQDESRTTRAYNSAETILKGEDDQQNADDTSGVYPASNHNRSNRPRQQDTQRDDTNVAEESGDAHNDTTNVPQRKDTKQAKNREFSATEQAVGSIDPKEKRKAMKNAKQTGGRQVTDPVTHLPIKIRDLTERDLSSLQENVLARRPGKSRIGAPNVDRCRRRLKGPSRAWC